MAHDSSVYLVYSVDDSVEWSNFMVNHLSQAALDVRRVELDSSGLLPASFSKFRRGRVIILLSSPGFVKSLLASQPDRLDSFVNQATDTANPVVLFLCGTMMKDFFEEVDAQGRRLSERFTGLNSWKTFEVDELNQLKETVRDLVHGAETESKKRAKTRPKMNFKLVPEEVRCEVWYIVCSLRRAALLNVVYRTGLM